MPRLQRLWDTQFVAPGDVQPDDEVLNRDRADLDRFAEVLVSGADALVVTGASQERVERAYACTRTTERTVLIRRHVIDQQKIDAYIARCAIENPATRSREADKIWRTMTDKEREIADRIACEKWPGR